MRYIDADKLIDKIFPIGLIDDGNYTINAKAVKIAIDKMPTSDVVPKSEVERLELTLQGVMWSVDKWLDEADYNADPVKRAIAMREKTLRIIETLKTEVEDHRDCWQKIHDSYNADCTDHYNKGREEVAREIFEEIEASLFYIAQTCEYCIEEDTYHTIKKKYTERKESEN